MTDFPFLLVGLGNPGAEYQLTRHNVGFLFLDYIADQCNCPINKNKFDGLYGRGRLSGKQVIFLQPQTYMNRSGISVRRFVDYFDVPVDQVLVVHDDIDLNEGRVKVVAKGGAGGHNGIKSIIQHLGVNQFARIKYGLGRPGNEHSERRQPVDRYVLSRLGQQEIHLLEDRFPVVDQAVALFIREGVNRCMSIINDVGKFSSETS